MKLGVCKSIFIAWGNDLAGGGIAIVVKIARLGGKQPAENLLVRSPDFSKLPRLIFIAGVLFVHRPPQTEPHRQLGRFEKATRATATPPQGWAIAKLLGC